MGKRLTQPAVDSLKPRTGRYIEWDAIIPGLGVQVGARRKSYIFHTRINGRQIKATLGRHPTMSLSEARKAAVLLRDDLEKGKTPQHRTKAATFGTIADAYRKRECPKLARGAEVGRILDRDILPAWRDRPWSGLRRRDAYELLDAVMDNGTPAIALKQYEIIRRIGRWAARRDLVEVNPFADMEAPATATRRDRVLSDDEIKALWKSCEGMDYPGGPLVKMYLLTGGRAAEVAEMSWSEIDLEARTWTVPGARTKNNRNWTVALSDPAMEILQSLPRFVDGDYVFSYTGGRHPVRHLENIKKAARKGTGTEDWTLHDLRRTARSLMARAGVRQEIAERCINHVSGRGVLVEIYDQHDYATEVRDAFERLAGIILNIVDPVPGGNVVQLREPV